MTIPKGEHDEQVVCTACPLVCEDIVLRAGGKASAGSQPRFERACDRGVAWLSRAWQGPHDPEAMVDGAAAHLDEAVRLAAKRLACSRRVLVTGCHDATLQTTAAAADLAESLQAAFDVAAPESAMLCGPVAARVGRVTADFEELRDRADCVLLWIDPTHSHPRFVERFLPPACGRGHRRVFVIGAEPVDRGLPGWTDVKVPLGQAAEAATVLRLMLEERLTGQPPPSRQELPAARRGLEQLFTETEVVEACLEAVCVGVVSGGDQTAATGLASMAISQLVIMLAHRKPAFEIPLSAGASGAGPATAAAVSTWRFGAAGTVAVADRDGGTLSPAEADACRLIERGEVDGLVVVGQPPEAVLQAMAGFDGLFVAVGGETLPQRSPQVWIGTTPTAIASDGQLLRDDGRLIRLRSVRCSSRPTAATVLAAIRAYLPLMEMP